MLHQGYWYPYHRLFAARVVQQFLSKYLPLLQDEFYLRQPQLQLTRQLDAVLLFLLYLLEVLNLRGQVDYHLASHHDDLAVVPNWRAALLSLLTLAVLKQLNRYPLLFQQHRKFHERDFFLEKHDDFGEKHAFLIPLK